MEDKTFIYELWDLFRVYKDKNLLTKIIFWLLNKFTDMRFIYLDEKGFYEDIEHEDYKFAEFRLQRMINDGLDCNSPRIVRLHTTLTLERMGN